ncbi:MAG: glycosyltransferase family 87 protein [Gemmataceae bacterium]
MISLRSQPKPDSTRHSPARDLAFLTIVSAFLVWGGREIMPWDKMFPDFISHWTAGKILASGQSPYSIELQTSVHRQYGWDKTSDGFGVYEFLPFYYPPWFGLLWVLAVPLGFEAAKTAWFFINVELALVSGYFLTQTAAFGIRSWIPMTVAPCFVFTIIAVLLGQTSILVFFLVLLGLRLLDLGHDRWAGVVLAWLTIKPQLTCVLLLGLFVWLIRQRRWQALTALLTMLGLLFLASTLIVPTWPYQLWNARHVTPIPTDHYPWIGNTWLLLLRSLGLEGTILWLLYGALAVPIVGVVLKRAWDRRIGAAEIAGLSAMAAFFVAPYARHYDFPILLIPVFLLIQRRRTSWLGALLLPILVLLPYLQMDLLGQLKSKYDPGGKFLVECTFFWVPILCLIVWLVEAWRIKPAANES